MTTTAPETSASTFGALIRRERMARGMTQEQFGEFVRVSETTVNQWEAGKTGPRSTRIPSLAKKLGIDPMEISRSINTPNA